MIKSSSVRTLLFIAWLLAVGFLALLFAFSMGAATYRHISAGGDKIPLSIKPLVETLAKSPGLIKQAVVEIRDELTSSPSALLISNDHLKKDGWVHKFPAPEDDGYLLLSGLSPEENQSIVQLIRISDGKVFAKWIPDWNDIQRQTTGHRFGPMINLKQYRAIHPQLLSDGSLIFSTSSNLIRLPLCSSKPSWILDYPYHHSIEISPAGNSVWVPSVTEKFATENTLLKEKLRDDSLAEVSLDGQVIQNLSFSKILTDNIMTSHMLGSSGFILNTDPLHINQITPAHEDGPYWKRNDLLISARHTSTVYLYRPSTGKVIWHQQGPWLNQHSAHFFNQHTISVFGNDVYGNKLMKPFIYKEGHNQIYLHDFKTITTSKLHSEEINKLRPATVTEGRARVLSDNSVFVEETNNSRLFKLNASGQLVWSYINSYDDTRLGAVSWSRYLTSKELNSTINFDKLNCYK